VPNGGQGFEQHPQVAGFENPFKQKLSLFDDLESSHRLLAQVLPLKTLCSATPDSAWWHYAGCFELGSILVAAGIHPPLLLSAGERAGLTVLLGYGGEQQVSQASQHWCCPSDGCLILSGPIP
jgi:hypothetical protein